jgi:hypothetical protein
MKLPRLLLASLAFFAGTTTLDAQWEPYPWKNMPRTPDGRVDMNAPARRTADGKGKDHPGVRCWPSGIPEKNNIPDGVKVVQTPDVMIFLHESRTIYRQIFTDGRPLPKDAQPTWMGYSVGRWEGDTFIVDTIGQNGKTWLDMRGLPGTEALRVTERFTRPNIGRINISVTIDDPIAYTKPWNVQLAWRLVPDTDLIESICEENNKDLPHMVGK